MSFVRTVRALGLVGSLVGLVALAASTADAKPAYAKKENKMCVYCHVVPGGDRNFRGMFYGTHDHSLTAFDEIFEAKAAGVKVDSMGPDGTPTVTTYPKVTVAPALNFVVKDIDGKTVNLGRFQGKVILMVNVASKCGFTPQYTGLEKLYEKYKDKGFVILGFPANEFGMQEPGTDKEIKAFCTDKYNVSFPMFSKIVVKSDDPKVIAPLYKYLTSKDTDPDHAGVITWNFNKFLIGRDGKIVDRFPSPVKPDDPKLTDNIEKLLSEPEPDKSASAN